ncbi:BrnT family toxin [Rhizobium sp. SSA_523]|uniref:BrnT family toxin n=1 Tax=Rhizobium sp. SSA_523 TaxID=2952477 RepID=UPI002090A195|nr:BrnT family toxin [Rhizobium sp. SSA_523]MCO5732755.1 BrnT family toxin [Rhizobium sp. SSA_523]WKC23625.1 BrnT family toxin [Rhizobium sp. SSA_523]
MELEWDEEKRQATLRERGLDFADIVYLDPQSIVVDLDLRKKYGEIRYNWTGMLDGVLCRVCWTPRHGRMRIISMRKINDRERKVYEKARERFADTR